MSNRYNLASSEFHSLRTASKKLFKIISKRLNVNTAYVTRRGKTTMTVLSSYNDKEEIIPEGYSVEYGGTYCRLIISNQEDKMSTTDLTKDVLTRDLDVTPQLNVKGFLGVTLRDPSGQVFGTLCVMDKEEKDFSDDDVEFLKSMADVLSHLIELDETKYNMGLLNVPIIPITNGVSILTIQGIIDDYRAEKILRDVLNYGAQYEIDYFIIDVSGLAILDNDFPQVLIDLVQSLQLMGIETIITGISPQLAKNEVNNTQLLHLNTKTVFNLEAAMKYIGFSLIDNNK
ncbi:STAS domain-containing protein [Halobacillus sp. BBL2006]|uniref:STAS domain-containing protein n=1 Tax=Halobacillus sp. BBL2006 TaxID=1543706 RepID=UPI0005430BE2|nr:STAS domain-containing protein [Halobacillus sp. BBL2006]KHE73028.1 anti-sigma factor antagonist [Halobacillus sp. BBL2006]